MRRFAIALTGIMATLFAAAAMGSALSDPTQPMDYIRPSGGVGTPAGPTGPVLQFTQISPDNKVAVISGKRVKVGDKYEDAVITEITSYEVRMNRGGREVSLRLLPKLTKEKGTVE